MDEYIERDSISEVLDGLVERIEDSLEHSAQFGSGCDYAIRYISNKVEDIQTADVRPERYGEWLVSGDCYECSECGGGSIVNTNPYCWKCGAKMDGKDSKNK